MPENEVQKNSEAQKNDDDEISLIDLLVVLIKYRRLLIIFAVVGLVVSAGYYGIQILSGRGVISARESLTRECEGRMTVVINPRVGRSGTDKFPAWFDSRELRETSLMEAGLSGRNYDTLDIKYTQNDGVDIILKPGPGDRERVEKFFSTLLNKAETMAAVYYAGYAEDIVSYFESMWEPGKDYSAQDYIRYCWAKDLLSGEDTVLKCLYPPFISGGFQVFGIFGASRTAGPWAAVVIFFAFLFFAVFLAFVLNAIKNISGDSEVAAKIRGALGKGDGA
ncbi:MAG: hypothetical protein LBP20_02185 [Treponema sp.]|jgi:hypothetical protein|nr:hypothetical protein [Treponema sp.]